LFVTVNILLLNLNICNMQQTVSLWRKRSMNYIEVSTWCVFSHQAPWEIFWMLDFLQGIDLLGHLRLILLPLKSLDHIHIIYSIIGHFQTQNFTRDDPAFYQIWCYVNLVTNFSLQFNIWCPCSTSQRRKNSWVSNSNY